MKMEREGMKTNFTGSREDFDNMLIQMGYIRKHISDRGQLELLAEEAAELSQAALKMCRLLGDNVGDTYPVNPDKYNVDICNENLIEEVVDVLICMDLIYDRLDVSQYADKVDKMYERINAAEREYKENNEKDVFPNIADRPFKVEVGCRWDAINLSLSLKEKAMKNGDWVSVHDLNILTGKDSVIYETKWGWTGKMIKAGSNVEFDADYHVFLVLPQPIFKD